MKTDWNEKKKRTTSADVHCQDLRGLRIAIQNITIQLPDSIGLGKMRKHQKQKEVFFGPDGDLNPGPPPPKGGIIPLDHRGSCCKVCDIKVQKLYSLTKSFHTEKPKRHTPVIPFLIEIQTTQY